MDLLRIVQLLTYSFGIYAFGSLILMWNRSAANQRSAERVGCAGHAAESRFAHNSGMLMLVTCFVWFWVMLIHTLNLSRPGDNSIWVPVLRLVLTYQFPPLIALVNYADARETPRVSGHATWKISLIALWMIAESILAYVLLAGFKVLPVIPSFSAFIGLTISGLFAIAAIFSLLVMSGRRTRRESERERSGRRWMLRLYLMMLTLVVLIVVAYQFSWPLAQVFEFIGTSLPLIFMFTATYHENRFEFFDLFIKRGLLVLATTVLLTTFFAAALPRLEAFELGWARPWFYSIVLLPAVLSLPWIYRKMGYWLDNVWLGRRLTTLEAMKRFLAGLGQAVDRVELVRLAEGGLREIFNAPVRIGLDLKQAPALDFDCVQTVPIPSQGDPVGLILLGRRANQIPYFSEDLALLGSLTDVFSYMLRTVELHEQKLEQEQLTRELSLQASRSELKALRAQIDPHFLFNALNAIAALIHQDPARADQTVEQLAEIFRYTLRGSESEWASVAEEMDFVRSYLEVERARFGKKLTVEVRTEAGAGNHVVPTMMIQTLVENAVKHGVARVRGPSKIRVVARVTGEQLIVSVIDNGPGFARPGAAPTTTGGYGLHNIRERLRGYFDGRAALELQRDEALEQTVVTLRLPLDRLEQARRRAGRAAGSDSRGAA